MLNFPDSPTNGQSFTGPNGVFVWDGVKWAPGTSATMFANPTARVGLGAVNGSATTAMRSDAAPALSQAITPTWTGLHTFNVGLNSSGMIDVAAPIRAAGNTPVAASGAGLELAYTGGVGYVTAYDRGASAYKAVQINGVNVTINPQQGGSGYLNVSGFTDTQGFRANGQSLPPGIAGGGVEVLYDAPDSVGVIQAHDRTAGQMLQLNLQGSLIHTNCPADVQGTLRTISSSTPASGAGMEMYWDGTQGVILTYDRTASQWKPTQIYGQGITLNPNQGGGGVLQINGETDISGPLVNNFASGTTWWQFRCMNTRGAAGDLGLLTGAGAANTANDTTTWLHLFADYNGTGMAGISRNGTGTIAYGTGSNADLKTTVHEASTRGLDTLRKIAVRDFYWNTDDERNESQGIYAQELEPLYPEAAMRRDNYNQNAERIGDLWMIDYGRLSPLAIRAIQQLADKVDALEAKIALLEAKLNQ